ncbi:hypothetical protein H4219_004940 [Mycoemilia scoparia]|uniref:Uncharacterized protein n=1 Tax=Mycoemilia scoparia TaxID=417184 RepID=A0A9W8DR10_9FUNG|nr:hypothetical protein H4219_004940 [Mycoemilia scoparia]
MRKTAGGPAESADSSSPPPEQQEEPPLFTATPDQQQQEKARSEKSKQNLEENAEIVNAGSLSYSQSVLPALCSHDMPVSGCQMLEFNPGFFEVKQNSMNPPGPSSAPSQHPPNPGNDYIPPPHHRHNQGEPVNTAYTDISKLNIDSTPPYPPPFQNSASNFHHHHHHHDSNFQTVFTNGDGAANAISDKVTADDINNGSQPSSPQSHMPGDLIPYDAHIFPNFNPNQKKKETGDSDGSENGIPRNYSFSTFDDPGFMAMPQETWREKANDTYLWFKARPCASFSLVLSVLISIFIGLLAVFIFVAYPKLMSKVISRMNVKIDTVHFIPPAAYYMSNINNPDQGGGPDGTNHDLLIDYSSLSQLQFVTYIGQFIGEVDIGTPLSMKLVFDQPIVITWKRRQVGMVVTPPDIDIIEGRGVINWTATNMLTLGQDFDASGQNISDVLENLGLSPDHLWFNETNGIRNTSVIAEHKNEQSSSDPDSLLDLGSSNSDKSDGASATTGSNSDKTNSEDNDSSKSDTSQSISKGVTNLNTVNLNALPKSDKGDDNPAAGVVGNTNNNGAPHPRGIVDTDQEDGFDVINPQPTQGPGFGGIKFRDGYLPGASPNTQHKTLNDISTLYDWLQVIQRSQPFQMVWSSSVQINNLGLVASDLDLREIIDVSCAVSSRCTLVDSL